MHGRFCATDVSRTTRTLRGPCNGLWCLLSAPLLLGNDLEKLDAFTLSLLTNDEVLAVNQDPSGRQAAQAFVDGRQQVWVKELEDGSRAADLWRQKDMGAAAERFSSEVPRHGVVLLEAVQKAEA
jgi:alpha-galactosidase